MGCQSTSFSFFLLPSPHPYPHPSPIPPVGEGYIGEWMSFYPYFRVSQDPWGSDEFRPDPPRLNFFVTPRWNRWVPGAWRIPSRRTRWPTMFDAPSAQAPAPHRRDSLPARCFSRFRDARYSRDNTSRTNPPECGTAVPKSHEF